MQSLTYNLIFGVKFTCRVLPYKRDVKASFHTLLPQIWPVLHNMVDDDGRSQNAEKGVN